MARKIFIGNYKGGVGKTTFTYNMGCILKEKQEDNKVLLIDLDPQSSLSEICFSTKTCGKFDELGEKETLNYVIEMYHKGVRRKVFRGLNLKLEKLIKNNGNVDFIPSSYFYKSGGLDIQCLSMVRDINNIMIFKNFFEDTKLDKMYDYILFDCPPSNNIITLSAFYVCDYYVIPTIMDSLSTKGVTHYKEMLYKYYNKYLRGDKDLADAARKMEPKILGVFESKRKKGVNTDNFREILSDKNFKLFETVIYDYKEISTSLETGQPTNEHRADFDKLINEILNQIYVLEESV